MSVNVGIVGATGYAGVELIRILLNHPQAKLAAISSVSFEGQPIAQVYPSLGEICPLVCGTAEQVIVASDVVFAALPHGLSETLARQCVDAGKKLIDLGADFRLESEDDYQEWYQLPYKDKEMHKHAVYGLCELFRDEIPGHAIVANPGCYPTSAALGLAPAIRDGMIETGHIIIDSKSGVTGAGRGLSLGNHFPECNEAFSPYKVAAHRHTPEIEQTLSKLAGKDVKITFVPHLLPVNRGIVSTMYAPLKEGWTTESVQGAYQRFYEKERFVRILNVGQTANLKHVKCSNYCDISVHVDARTSTLVIVSAIDNMVKGAAGQAVQNLNILCGFAEDTALGMIPPAF